MKDYLVGCTGFVGSNLAAEHTFAGGFHSTDIEDAFGGNPDLLVYAGVPAEMFLANRDPAADLRRMEQAVENMERIAPRRVTLISTVTVYPDPRGVDEDTDIASEKLTPYGVNRYWLERQVEERFPDSLILRLPALYGKNLKKNFLYDFIHRVPALLTEEKYGELHGREAVLAKYYVPQGNGFYRCHSLEPGEETLLKEAFRRLGFSALNFTDSRSRYQFYHLRMLWCHMEKALELGIPRLNLATPPVQVDELYRRLTGESFRNELNGPPFDYDMRTKHDGVFGGAGGYIMDREQELQEIGTFVAGALT